MFVKSKIVDSVDEARIESYLFWGPDVVELLWALEAPEVVFVLGPWHQGERIAEDPPFCEKCGGTLDERLCPRRFGGVMSMQYN